MRRVNLDHADFEPQNLLDVGQNILAVPGMKSTAGDEASGILLCVIGNPLIHASGKADDVRRDIVDENCPIHAGGVQVIQKGLGGSAKFQDLIEVVALFSHQLERIGTEHLKRRDMNVAIGDQVGG